jgi:hypothetical protein
MLPEIRNLLSVLEKHKDAPKKYGVGPGEYYDDLCLARLLEGVCLRYVAYPVGVSFVLFLGGLLILIFFLV